MDKKEFEALVNARMINEVGFVDFYMQNPSEMEKLTVKDLANIGTLSQPQANNFIIENGAASADGMSTEEFFVLLEKGGNIKLLNDIILDTQYASIKTNVNLDLNGHKIIAKTRNTADQTVSYGLVVFTGAELVIDGEGEIICEPAYYSTPIWAFGGKVIINNGVYKNAGKGSDLIYASKTGEIIINNGEFIACKNQFIEPGTQNEYTALNKLDADRNNCDIIVRGGRFYKFDPSNNLSEGPNTNFVDDGYIVVQKGDFYEVVKDEIVVEE